MSIYEKIASVIIVILLVLMVVFSYREFRESPEQIGGPRAGPDFDESIGENLKIGSFATIVSEHSSGGREDNCETLQPVIVGALHDIKERLEHQKIYIGVEDAFEVNKPTLQILCDKSAEITLADTNGNTLVLEKIPFEKVVPLRGSAVDVGTRVRINATLVPVGGPMPSQPTTYGDVLIPDRFLDVATSSAH